MIRTTAIIGMGALGLLYADQITTALGEDAVTFVMNEERYHKYRDQDFSVNGVRKSFRMEIDEQAKPYDLVIVAVKYNSLNSALDTMRNCVGKDTIILSVMNGISSEEIISERYGKEHLLNTVAQGMDAMHTGCELHFSKQGELHIGAAGPEQNHNLEIVKAYFDMANVPYVVEQDIQYRMWCKFMLNVGINQVCHAFETDYAGAMKKGSKAREVLIQAMQEVVALAKKEKIPLTEKDIDYDVEIIESLCPTSYPSMRQDGVAKRRSEVEMFAGTVIKMADKYKMAVPTNTYLYQRIQALERAY